MDTTSYHVQPGFFEVTGRCQLPLTWVFCLDIIYLCAWKLQGCFVLFCFVWKLLGKGKEIFFWKIMLSKEKQENEISVHRISVTLWWITIAQWASWLKVSFPVIFSHWWTWTWMNLCCLRHQRPFWGSSQGSLVNHKTLVLIPWPAQVIVSSSDNIFWAIAVH